MNLFFGKISKEFDRNQIEEGYYQAPKDSGWFGDISIGDYTYLIGGDRIQFWQAKEWRVVDGNDRLYFDVMSPDLEIGVNDLTALNFLKISKALLVLTSRSSRKAFFKLEIIGDFSSDRLKSKSFYESKDIYRNIKIVSAENVIPDSKDIQLVFKNNTLSLMPADFYDHDVYAAFRDNLKYLGQGSRNKDNILAVINGKLGEEAIFDRTQIGLRAFYDAFFCDYKEAIKYFLVGAFWEGNDPEDLTDLFVSENRWENGYDNKFMEETNAIPRGSRIAIKSAYVRNRTNSVIKIKARGVVKKNYNDGHHLDVEWEKNFKPFELLLGGYRTTIKEVVDKEHIDSIWELDSNIKQQTDMEDNILELIKYKKQIILQGPPGTGKTKKAKELALRLVEKSSKLELNEDILKKLFKVGLVVKTVFGNVEYVVQSFMNNNIELKRENGSSGLTSVEKVLDFYKNKKWISDINGNDTRRAAALAKYLNDNIHIIQSISQTETIKVVQFHPSYSYEDFVRGIVAETKAGGIEYKSVNKVLGKLAQEALLNWNDSKKSTASISKEKQVKQYFESFTDEIRGKLENGVLLSLTDRVDLVDVEDDAFRYKGKEGWTVLGNRMSFTDIIGAFLDDNHTRQDIKRNNNLSGLAKQHASYYIRVLAMFREYLQKNNLGFENLSEEKVHLKNYVLIIDEINRANLSSVLGELIYALEYRGEPVESIYEVEQTTLTLPPNLFIIGTMNTADRSVGHIDYAIRRRFAFVDIPPKDLSDDQTIVFAKQLFSEVEALFSHNTHLSPEFDPKDVRMGHSYFIDKANEGGPVSVRLEYEIKPILREYIKDGILVGDGIKAKIEQLKA